MHQKTSNIGSFLQGLLIGGLAGSAAALLSAPQSGRETRRQIQSKSSEIMDIAERKVDDVLSTLGIPANEPKSDNTDTSEEQSPRISTEMM